jgi:putative glutathione S-transferase
MFNSAFEDYTDAHTDYYPEDLCDHIDEINEPIYAYANNGVYRCGSATSQKAYEDAFDRLFETLNELEAHWLGSAISSARS